MVENHDDHHGEVTETHDNVDHSTDVKEEDHSNDDHSLETSEVHEESHDNVEDHPVDDCHS